MDRELVTKICELKGQGKLLALISIIKAQGSTPRKAGTAMLIEEQGECYGTVGGGSGEAQVVARALRAIREQKCCLYSVNLQNEVAADEGMVCGGIMEFFIKVI